MSKKVFAFTIIILLVLSTASPAFASNSHSVSVYYPEPYVDEYAGYFSYSTSSGDVYTYAWTFLPYRSSTELNNNSPFVEVTYSSNSLRFDILPGFTTSTNFILYRFYNSASSTSPSLTMMEYVTIVSGTNFTYSSPAPVAVALQGPVAFNNAENSAYFALDITFSEDSNTNYNVELFYNYYKNMMDMLYPAITAAFADINNIDLSVDNIENYTSRINSMTNSIINLLTIELTGSGTGTLDNPYTIRDLLVQIVNKSGSEYSDSDLDEIERVLTSISDEDLASVQSLLTDIISSLSSIDWSVFESVVYLEEISYDVHAFYHLFSDYFPFESFPVLLERTLSVLNSDFYENFLKDHFIRQELHFDRAESFYDSVESFIEAYNASQVVDERLRYDDFQESSLRIFSIFYRGVLKPFRDFWSNLYLDFKFDSGTEPSIDVVYDYLFDGDKYPGFNNLESVDWSTLP